uniref:Iron(III) transport system ATP-binding protein n=1 Tax=Candidatus Kentrum sp. TC TaxID=2126339 RepID=A0A450ZYI4_9GAMM|nr:MAG: iron(III) transport system ATP-binding protein [Candidatus Kentron sp. TC]
MGATSIVIRARSADLFTGTGMLFNHTRSVGIELKNIDLSYGDTRVIKNISLEIDPGEFFAFLGPSGCGKSTLLRLIAGFEQCQRGEIFIGDEEISHLPPWKRNVGMVFQNYALWPHMTVRKNVAFGLEERRMPRNRIKQRVDDALELVGLQDYALRRPNQLSGGQQQRVALARTIVIEPRVLLLDEPLSNLDAGLRARMRQELLELQRKLSLTTIFVTHDQEEANATSDRIAVLKDGVVQQVGAPMELYDRPENLFVAQFLGSANVLRGNIEKQGNEMLFDDGQGLRISLSDSLSSRDVRGSGSIVFRPQNLTLCDVDSPSANLRGKIKIREFLGTIMRYEVEVGRQRLIVDDVYRFGKKPSDTGSETGLRIDKEHILVLEHVSASRQHVFPIRQKGVIQR